VKDDISLGEWMQQLEKLDKQQSGNGVTMRELSYGLNIGETRLRRMVRDAIASGKCYCSGTRKAKDIAGRTAAIPVYSLVRKRKK
jgi:hypothetical protein